MSDFLDRYHQQLLVGAAQVLPVPTPARRRRLTRNRRALGVMLALLVVMAAALTATGSWRSVLEAPDGAKLTTPAPPLIGLATLGVLRRPSISRDSGPRTRDALRQLGASARELHGFVRLLAAKPHNAGVVLVPAVASSQAFRNGSPGLRERLVATSPLCVFYPGPGITGSVSDCWNQRDVQDGRATASVGTHQYGLVPNGVASVVLTYRDGLSREGTVRDNFFDVAAPPAPARLEGAQRQPITIGWRDKRGREVAAWPRP